jgi:hypothetical protein
MPLPGGFTLTATGDDAVYAVVGVGLYTGHRSTEAQRQTYLCASVFPY